MGDKEDPAKRKLKEKPPFLACQHCGAVLDPDQVSCPQCGLDRPTRVNQITTRDGKLVEFGAALNGDAHDTTESPYEFYRMAAGYALAHGQKPGRAYHLTRARFPGFHVPWDWRSLSPLTPSAGVARWIKNRNLYDHIRYQRGSS